jgi:hypothetical protein
MHETYRVFVACYAANHNQQALGVQNAASVSKQRHVVSLLRFTRQKAIPARPDLPRCMRSIGFLAFFIAGLNFAAVYVSATID